MISFYFLNKLKLKSSKNEEDGFIVWLQSRIKKTEVELLEAEELNLKIGKGAKLKTYKEILNYKKTH